MTGRGSAAPGSERTGSERTGSGGIVSGLRVRLALMMLLALLPLGLLSLGQTRNILDQADQGQELAALGETLRAAEPEILTIRAAQTTAAVLALAIAPLSGDDAACLRLVEGAAAADPRRSLVAYVPRSGLMTCTTAGAGTDLSGNANFRTLIDQPQPQILASQRASISGTSVLVVTHPVIDPAGRVTGYVAISLPHRGLTMQGDGEVLFPGAQRLVSLMTFDAQGEVLTASAGLDAAARDLPAGESLAALASPRPRTFFAETAAGARRLFTMIPLAGGLFLLGVWESAPTGFLTDLGLHPYAFPLMMWIAGLTVAILGADRLVIRHLRRLGAAMRRFTFGERSAPELRLDDPPAEIATLADTYRTLTDTILRDEAELENLIRQKEELLREVHHRTGNSLQLIASILRMHRRETADAPALALIDALHSRVMSLSTVHLGLYRIAGRADVAMDVLMAEVIAKVAATHWRAGRHDAIRADLHPVELTAQQAVPLALLLAEMLSCFPASALEGDAPPVRIRLRETEMNLAELEIAMPEAAAPTLTGEGEGAPAIIAHRLIRSFVSQLDGKLSIRAEPPQVVATVTFTIRLARPEPAHDRDPRPQEATA